MADLNRYLSDCKFILVSNREPYEHFRGVNGVEVKQPAGGLVSALDPTMRHIHGTWVAWGSGSADRETADGMGRVRVPPDEQSYVLRRVWLDEADVEGYYHGFANRALWPFWHIPFPPPDILRLLPSGTHEALLRGLLGNDLLEFQTDRHALNFLDCVEQFVGDA